MAALPGSAKELPLSGCGFLHHGKKLWIVSEPFLRPRRQGLCKSRSLRGEAVMAPKAGRGSGRCL